MILKTSDIIFHKDSWANKKVVFTNGCFDILHRGHVSYLNKAKGYGNYLIVGLNTDSSIKRIKGNSRPIIKEADRAFLLDNLEAVDAVILFDEETPLDLIKSVKPNILVKGSDYIKENVVGKEEVEKNGGKVKLIQFEEGFSTSSIVERIKKLS